MIVEHRWLRWGWERQRWLQGGGGSAHEALNHFPAPFLCSALCSFEVLIHLLLSRPLVIRASCVRGVQISLFATLLNLRFDRY